MMKQSELLWRGHGSFSARKVLMDGFVCPPELGDPPLTGEIYSTVRIHTAFDKTVQFTPLRDLALLYAMKEVGTFSREQIASVFDSVFASVLDELMTVREYFLTKSFRVSLGFSDIGKKIRHARKALKVLDRSSDRFTEEEMVVRKKTLLFRIQLFTLVKTSISQLSDAEKHCFLYQFPVLFGFSSDDSLLPLSIPKLEKYREFVGVEVQSFNPYPLRGRLRQILVPSQNVSMVSALLEKLKMNVEVDVLDSLESVDKKKTPSSDRQYIRNHP